MEVWVCHLYISGGFFALCLQTKSKMEKSLRVLAAAALLAALGRVGGQISDATTESFSFNTTAAATLNRTVSVSATADYEDPQSKAWTTAATTSQPEVPTTTVTTKQPDRKNTASEENLHNKQEKSDRKTEDAKKGPGKTINTKVSTFALQPNSPHLFFFFVYVKPEKSKIQLS